MPPICEFVGTLTVTGKNLIENGGNNEKHLGQQILKNAAVQEYKKSEGGGTSGGPEALQRREEGQGSNFNTDIAAKVPRVRHVTIRKCAQAHGVLTKTIHDTVYEDLNLFKKSAIWVPKLFTEEMNNETVRTCKAFLTMIHRHSMAMIDRIVTMISPWHPSTGKGPAWPHQDQDAGHQEQEDGPDLL
jgi:hypothetical protein